MEFERIKPGMLAWSRAGHDKGNLYIVLRVEDDYVFLADGRIRTITNPKKKKRKHVQIKFQIPEELSEMNMENLKNEEIKYVIKCHIKTEL